MNPCEYILATQASIIYLTRNKDIIFSKKYGCSNARFTHRSSNMIHLSTKSDDSIRYMSLHDNKYLRYFKGHTAKVVSMEMSPLDDTFITSSLDNTTRMWDLRQPASTVS
jgi:COMPASS component SWD2